MAGVKFVRLKYIGVVTLLAVSLFSCNKKRTSPGYIYFPDMTYSQAFETYSENPNFKDDMTLRIPPEGTIPRGYTPFPYEKTEEDMIQAGKELVNPFEPTEENITRGALIFKRDCKQCHGELGDGQGHLYTSKRYPYPPASLINDKMKVKPQGEMFQQVTLGYGVMGPQGLILRPQDRWKVILYIKNVLQK
jgi:mono/diheme cytochrome c family protein